MNARLKKSWADIWRRKGRSLLVALGIFVGIFGLTSINVTQATIFDAFAFTNTNSAPHPDITWVVDRLNPTPIPALQAVPNVHIVQYETSYDTTWRISASPGQAPITIRSYPDLQHVPLTPFQLTSGRLPGPGEVVMEYTDRTLQPFSLGDVVTVDGPEGLVHVHVVGIARTTGVNPAATGIARAYMSDAGLQRAFVPAGTAAGAQIPHLNRQIQITLQNRAQAHATADQVTSVLQMRGVMIMHVTIMATGTSLPTRQISSVFTLLRLLAILAVAISCVLVFGTVATLVAEQTAIIGTMKAIGGGRRAIVGGYLMSVALYGLVGTLPGIAAGVAVGYPLATYLAASVPLDVGPLAIAPWIVLLSLAVGLGAPVLAAMGPLWNGARVSVYTALHAYGVSTPQGGQRLAWLGRWMPWMPQTVWLGLRATFRKRGRAALTLLTLSLAAATFLVVQTANASVASMVRQVNAPVAADIEVDLGQPAPIDQASAWLRSQSGVRDVEPYDQASRVGTRWGTLTVTAYTPNTQLYHYQVLKGRWLNSADTNAVLLSDAAAQTASVRPGDSIRVTNGTVSATWLVVGIIKQPTSSLGDIGAAVTTVATLNTLEGVPLAEAEITAPAFLVQAVDRTTPHSVDHLATRLRSAMDAAVGSGAGGTGLFMGARVSTLPAATARAEAAWSLLYALLDGAALLVGLAGVLGLANALATSVVERQREIGTLKALGANKWQVALVFWIEGLAFGSLAWVIAGAIGLPLAYGFVRWLDHAVIPVDFLVDPAAFGVMLAAVAITATCASVAPAVWAARSRVGDLLRYE